MMESRYEIRFVITMHQKDRFLDAARSGLVEDPNGRNGSYRVTSQYFDVPGLAWYWERIDGIEVRKKVRLRYYGDAGGARAPLHDSHD